MPEPGSGDPIRLKPSRYNRIIPLDDGVRLAFNATTAALSEIDPETYPVVSRLLERPDSARSPQENEILDHLIEGRYLVPAGEDERSLLKTKNRLHRSSNPVFFLTIAPTLGCNFDCDYCFQRHDSVRMTRETEEALIAFSEEPISKSQSVLVTWFGGEPTLCLQTIERIQTALAGIAKRQCVTMDPASIVTNGHLLDGRIATRLVACGVESAQVTLDGPGPVHDRRRKLRGGQGTFRRILRNLNESASILRIVVRVNVDRENMDSVPAVLEALEKAGVLSRVKIYFAPVNATDGVCTDVTGRCFTNDEFARRQLGFYEGLIAGGFTQIDYPELATGGYCGADTENGWVVAPNGLLFKCWEELSLDSARSVGSVFTKDREPHQEANLRRYLSWDPFEKGRCVECDILPLCMGGCPLQATRNAGSERGACIPWRHNLAGMLRLRYACEPERR